MSLSPPLRVARVVAWLLTPIAVWAASFFGGWFGALLGEEDGLRRLGIGSVLGGAAGLYVWLRVISRLRRDVVSRQDQRAFGLPLTTHDRV